LHNAEAGLSLQQLRQRVERRIEQEEELLIDPAFFTALRQHLPKISRVEVEPKRGRHQNELTQFRYQVTIHAGGHKTAQKLSWIDWREVRWDLAELRRRLIHDRPATLALTNVANARLAGPSQLVEILDTSNNAQTAGELKTTLGAKEAIDPEDLYRLQDELAYQVHLSWARHGADGSFDVLLQPLSEKEEPVDFPAQLTATKSLSDYVNHPLEGKQARRFGPQLRSFLKERLPEHMVPASFVTLDTLPLLPNGKIDRRALPEPEAGRPDLPHAFAAPRNPLEQSLAATWSDLLGVPQIGIHDNFFDLGGHSLLATQLISRVRELFKIELALRQVFQQPTIAELATVIEQEQNNPATHDVPPIVRVSRESRRLARGT
jgi:acyl carrier protein